MIALNYVSGLTKFFAPLMVGLPFQSSRHREQVSHQRKFFRTRWKRKTLPSVLPTKEKRYNERNNSEEVKNDHIWRPAEESDKQSKKTTFQSSLASFILKGALSANRID